MTGSLRWRLAALFLTLSAGVYLAVTLVGMAIFHIGLSEALDDELDDLAAEVEQAIDLNSTVPDLVPMAAVKETSHARPLATIQLYDSRGRLLKQFGPPGVVGLAESETEKAFSPYPLRIFSRPLKRGSTTVGYLQLEHPTKVRDNAVRYYLLALAATAPLVLLALGTCGYYFAGRAVKPVAEALQVLRRFMADAGHELSTPISIIQVNAEALQEEVGETRIPGDRLSVILRTAERMATLVADLSFLARAESPRLVSQAAPVALGELVASVVEEFQQLFRTKDISLELKIVEQATVHGAVDALKRAIANLLSNALRYTDSGGRVAVTLERRARTARISVADTGVGIPEESLGRIFERFYTVEESRSRAAGGSGLGLAIVKAIVDAHGGQIEVTSQPGQGSTFTIILPAAP